MAARHDDVEPVIEEMFQVEVVAERVAVSGWSKETPRSRSPLKGASARKSAHVSRFLAEGALGSSRQSEEPGVAPTAPRHGDVLH